MKQFPVCFTAETALCITREVSTSKLNPIAKRLPLPNHIPSMAELDNTAQLVSQICPAAIAHKPVRCLVGGTAQRRAPAGYSFQFTSANLSSGSLFKLQDNVLVASPALALAQIAARHQHDPITMLELIWELCGTYRTTRTGECSQYQVDSLLDPVALRTFLVRNSSLNGTRQLAKLIKYVAAQSASPRETKLALLLGLPKMYGGFGLGIPLMNYTVPASPAAQAISGRSYFKCDLCWPHKKLDVEYQSREMHSGEVQRISDSRRTNALAAMGWKVIGVTNDELDSLTATRSIAEAVRRHLGIRPRTRVSHYHSRQLELRRKLSLPIGYDYDAEVDRDRESA